MSSQAELLDSAADDFAVDSAENYRALSSAAVTSLVLGLLSFLAFLDWTMLVIPILGLLAGILAILRVRARPHELTGRWLATFGAALSLACLVGGASTLSYIYANELPPGHKRVSYEDLQPNPRVSEQAIPESAYALEGEHVFIKGYMYPGSRQLGIQEFTLVRDRGTCCFGGNPKITDRIVVHLSDPQGVEFSTGVFKVAGVFHVKPQQAVGATGNAFYTLDKASVR